MESVAIYLGVFLIGTMFLKQGTHYRKTINIMSVIGLMIIILFAAGRYYVGTDCVTYNNIFARYAAYDWKTFFQITNAELLFALVAKVTFSAAGRVLTWGAFAALTVVPVYYTLKEEYPHVSFGVAMMVFLISFYTTSFNVTRQFVAVAIVFWGVKYVYNNRFVPFALSVVIASGFHQTAIIAILLWFLWDHKTHCAIIGWRRVCFLIGITLVIIFYQNVIEYLSSNISSFDKYESYTEISDRGKNRDLIVSIVEMVVLFLFRNPICNKDKRNDFLYSLLIISVLIGFTGFTHPQVKRIAYYFAMPSTVVLFSYLPTCFRNESRVVSKILIIGWFAGLFILTAYILGQANLIPYRFDLFSPW